MTFMPPAVPDPRRRWRRQDPGARPVALAMAAGALLATGLLLFDVGGLHTRLWRADAAPAGAVLFILVVALAFGAAAAGLRTRRRDDDEPRGGLRAPALARSAARRRRF